MAPVFCKLRRLPGRQDVVRTCAGADEGTSWVHGWEAQLAHILATSRNLSFVDRVPQAVWRGRHEGGRDWLRQDACTQTQHVYLVQDQSRSCGNVKVKPVLRSTSHHRMQWSDSIQPAR